jgi:ferredoxin-type protein NapH
MSTKRRKGLSKRQRIRKALIFISMFLFPITIFYFSPALPLMSAAEKVVNGSLIVFASLFISSLLFGRAFCGWVCPGAGIGEACMVAVDKKAKNGKANLIKWIAIWIPWIVILIVLVVLNGGYERIDMLYELDKYYGISILNPSAVIIYFIVVPLIVILSFTTGRRGFCHYSCWMSPFMIIGTKIKETIKYPSLHLTADKEKCIHCKICSDICPMSLDVMDGMVNADKMYHHECILCGMCVDRCPKDVIHFSFVYSKKN